jgi:hypothetical protein
MTKAMPYIIKKAGANFVSDQARIRRKSMRGAILFIAAALLVACGNESHILSQGTTSTMPAISSELEQSSDASAAVRPDILHVKVLSYLFSGTVNGQSGTFVGKGNCTLVAQGTHAVGCYIHALKTITISKSSWYLYSGKNASGCEVALAHYSGTVSAGQLIPLKYAIEDRSCWQP